jgi:hypothetical protein
MIGTNYKNYSENPSYENYMELKNSIPKCFFWEFLNNSCGKHLHVWNSRVSVFYSTDGEKC